MTDLESQAPSKPETFGWKGLELSKMSAAAILRWREHFAGRLPKYARLCATGHCEKPRAWKAHLRGAGKPCESISCPRCGPPTEALRAHFGSTVGLPGASKLSSGKRKKLQRLRDLGCA